MAPTDACPKCGGRDTLVHRLIECEAGSEQWDWMKTRIAAILFMDKQWIPDHWILRPQINVWPPKRPRAILWMLAHFSVFRTNNNSSKTNANYLMYLQGAFQTIYDTPKRMESVGEYLSVLTMDTATMRNWLWRKVPGVVFH